MKLGTRRAKELQLENHRNRLAYAERMGFDETYIESLESTISEIETELRAVDEDVDLRREVLDTFQSAADCRRVGWDSAAETAEQRIEEMAAELSAEDCEWIVERADEDLRVLIDEAE